MAKNKKSDEPVEGGPPYEAAWVVDESQRPDTVLERHRRNAASPAAAAAFEAKVREKAAKEGLIHVDPATGYKARFHPADVAA